MKTLQEINAIRDRVAASMNDLSRARIYIGMATCGLSAGAQPVYDTLKAEIAKAGLDIEIIKVGCIGMCKLEPLFDVQLPGKPRVTYISMTAEKTAEVVAKHLKGGQVVEAYAVKE